MKKRWGGDLVVVRGGGDLATGVVQKFFRAGMRVVVLETRRPTAIRRTVSLCEAVYDQQATVEDMTARRADSIADCSQIWRRGEIPLLIDPLGKYIPALSPDGVIDAILAKKNLGLKADMAPAVIALGPGFCAPRDAHVVVETMRGHDLGRLIFSGEAKPNTGVPGKVGGRGAQRVLRAPREGHMLPRRSIGDWVRAGEPVFSVADDVVCAPFDGRLRGLLREGHPVWPGMKAGDIDPRPDSDCKGISDKARCLGGGALEAYLYLCKGVATHE